MGRWRITVAVCFWIAVASGLHADDATLRDQVAKSLRKGVDYFRKEVSVEGAYLWRYSDDLARREGERKATATQAWVQPPGTPSVGLAFLNAYELTRDKYYLEAARETALALVKGQLRSGGWDYLIEFDPQLRKNHAYRGEEENDKARNVSTLDDNNTQEAIRLLMRVDRALEFKDKKIHDAVEFSLESLLKHQYPNGAWPQRFDRPPEPEKFPVKKASFPESWPREFPGTNYMGFYTFNDNSISDVVDVLLEAARTYEKPRFRQAAEKAGGFIILAQMPEPQPGWAQQYDVNMHPAWARKFEPPSVTGGESMGVMRTLLQLYRETGDKKYLEPIPPALAYYQRSRIAEGRLARFYELKTSKPLYFTKDYQLTYKDDDLPTHYAFKVADRTDQIKKEYDRLRALDPADLKKAAKPGRPSLSKELVEQTKAVLAAQDDRGRWVIDGKLRNHGADDPTRRILDTRTLIKNIGILSRYLAATASEKP